MDDDAIWRVIDDERSRLADLLDELGDAEWRTPSLCAAWTVRDVVAHLTLAHASPLTAAVGLIRAGGNFDRTIRDTAIRQARLPVPELRRRLRAMVGSRRIVPFLVPIQPMIDVLCHAQDIARPLGRTHPMPVAPAVAAADRIWGQSFPFRSQRRLRGFELVATDAPWRAGSGVRVEGPMSALLLLVTGRPAALAELSGPGVAGLPARFPHVTGTTPTKERS